MIRLFSHGLILLTKPSGKNGLSSHNNAIRDIPHIELWIMKVVRQDIFTLRDSSLTQVIGHKAMTTNNQSNELAFMCQR